MSATDFIVNQSLLSNDSVRDDAMTAGCRLYTLITMTVVIGTLCIVGMIGNTLAFIVFWKDSIKTSASFLFQGLSLIDTALLATALPLYSLRPIIGHTEQFARVFPYFEVALLPCAFIAQTATIWVTVLVAVNRYVAVCLPYRASRLCTVHKARRQLCAVLILALLYNVPKFFEAKVELRAMNDTDNNCTHWFPEPVYTGLAVSPLYHIIYGNILYLFFLLIIPLFILSVLNVRLINALNRLRRRRKEMQSARQQADNNATVVLIVVVLVFTICQVPALVNLVLWNTAGESLRACGGFQFYLRCIANMLVILNSAVNFLIYYFFNTRFRHVLLKSVCGGAALRNSAVSSASLMPNKRSDTTIIPSSNGSHYEACKADDPMRDTFL